ncbi:MAG: hypothetical protein HQK77_08710 [Desulfobacterales bacterium]|nr:hypothetical protein [Desulfobacterales bacterium]
MNEEIEQKKLSYSAFTMDMVRKKFDIRLTLKKLFDDVELVQPSDFLKTVLRRSSDLFLYSEKARSEFIIAPVLLEIREMLNHSISIYSGMRLDVSPEEGLQGICDFIITGTPPFPSVQAPLIMLVEAKRNAVEEGLGQCAAEMIAAHRLNQEDKLLYAPVYGCVTTGELWQFLQLNDKNLLIDPTKIYIEHIDRILGTLLRIGRDNTVLLV